MPRIVITINDTPEGVSLVSKPSFLDMGKKIKDGVELSPAETMGVLILKSIHDQSKIVKAATDRGIWKPGQGRPN